MQTKGGSTFTSFTLTLTLVPQINDQTLSMTLSVKPWLGSSTTCISSYSIISIVPIPNSQPTNVTALGFCAAGGGKWMCSSPGTACRNGACFSDVVTTPAGKSIYYKLQQSLNYLTYIFKTTTIIFHCIQQPYLLPQLSLVRPQPPKQQLPLLLGHLVEQRNQVLLLLQKPPVQIMIFSL